MEFTTPSVDDLFSRIEAVPLETNDSCLLMRLTQVLPHGNSLYVWTGVAPVMQVDLPQRRIYQLGEKLYFCPEGCCVQEEGGEAVSFSPLECHAMLMFIAAERHELSSMDLVDGLWQGKANRTGFISFCCLKRRWNRCPDRTRRVQPDSRVSRTDRTREPDASHA